MWVVDTATSVCDRQISKDITFLSTRYIALAHITMDIPSLPNRSFDCIPQVLGTKFDSTSDQNKCTIKAYENTYVNASQKQG
jgi:hypothetical protein